MELTRLIVRGYRRFAERADLRVDGKLIALVGPNEAGKTSLLRALTHLNHDDAWAVGEYTRGSDRKVLVQAHYALNDADREVIAHLRGAEHASEFVVWKGSAGGVQRAVRPALSWDVERRSALATLLTSALKSGWAKGLDDDAHALALVHQAQADLVSEDEIDPEALARLEELAALIENEPLPARLHVLPERLRELTAEERNGHPGVVAASLLEGHRPDFAFFEDDERLLSRTYGLDVAPNGALSNVLDLAGVSWDDIRTAVAEGDKGRLEALEKRANAKLEAEFQRSWTQRHTPLTVRLRVDGNELHILIPTNQDDYLFIDERSDGIRQFIALRAFVAARNYLNPVLLIDEAERHLHYDAQADLVQVLAEQTDAPKVIYSTHSAGCLPQDLGTGVRAVVPIEGSDHSKLQNSLWSDGAFGFSPLLFGMGASTLALSSARKAVIGEGITEALLLPTLLREATRRETLDFQVAPGLSNASVETFEELDLTAARVVYLVDADKGGRDRRKMLLGLHVPDKLILTLGNRKIPGLTLEDLVDPGALAAAVNSVLEPLTHHRIATSDLPETGRLKAVESWCKGRTPPARVPGKRAIAEKLVEMRGSRRLVDPRRLRLLRALNTSIEKQLAGQKRA